MPFELGPRYQLEHITLERIFAALTSSIELDPRSIPLCHIPNMFGQR